ncbi:undecaprenyl-diphosphate phosphatase [Tolypothrix sp. VBCCA 56010]|uniref:undecaprenyl-diphosphate phosphatase n=1 Tax=Tolypothrix sp. VBCCA 56010 TaxID=3137731 RepID=UPI003D7EB5BD
MGIMLEAGLDLLLPTSSHILQVGVPSAVATSEPNLIQQIIQAFILGIVQGITEFLPISSTAHLQVFTKALGWELLGEKSFVATIQFGSVIAVLIYFWKDISLILTGGWVAFQEKNWRRDEWQLLVGVAIGTLPILVVGFAIKDLLNDENSAINSMTTIAIDSIVMALLLGAAEKFGSRKRDFNSLKIRDGLLIGLGQMLALAPGVSRSGATLTTALFLGLQRETAAKFSFLLGIPALTIATLYEFIKEALGKIDLVLVGVGTLSAFIFSYISIAWLLRYLQRKDTWIFVWYRLAFGVAILSAIAAGMLKNN